MNNEMRVLIARELASPRFYDEEKFMMLLRAVPDEILQRWCYMYLDEPPSETDSESDDDLDARDANGSVLSVDINSVYPN
jgi:hypothetical protein